MLLCNIYVLVRATITDSIPTQHISAFSVGTSSALPHSVGQPIAASMCFCTHGNACCL
jgi:hypothetical protein